MSRVLFAAHDIGGANMLSSVIPLCKESSYKVFCCPSGPAIQTWKDWEPVIDDDADKIEDILNEFSPNLVVTGTSHPSEFEQLFWECARQREIITIAAIDAWINIRPRFVKNPNNILCQPNVICVIDDYMKDEIEDQGWCASSIHVIGQPYLEKTIQCLHKNKRETERSRSLNIVFISEPIFERGIKPKVGYDQYSVATLLVSILDRLEVKRLVIKPHPSEKLDAWSLWRNAAKYTAGIDIIISEESIETLLSSATIVIGMASMVLIEAALAGIPILAIQPDRLYDPNPVLIQLFGINVISRSSECANALNELIDKPSKFVHMKPLLSTFQGSGQRFLSIIDNKLKNAERKEAYEKI